MDDQFTNRRLRRASLRAWTLGREAVAADARIDHHASEHGRRRRDRDARLAWERQRAGEVRS